MDSTVSFLNLILPIWSFKYGIQSLSALTPPQLQPFYQATSTSTQLELLSYIKTRLATELAQIHDSIVLTYGTQQVELAITHLTLGKIMTAISFMISDDDEPLLTRVTLTNRDELTFE
ncbi:MAG: hypothetical protein WC208_13800 [Gallionella sp.]|jgi:hypothetical protein